MHRSVRSPAARRPALLVRVLLGLAATVVGVLAPTAMGQPASAQPAPCAPPAVCPSVPDAPVDSTMPGSNLVSKAIGWLKFGALAAAVVGILVGGVQVGVGHFGSNYSASSAGRKWLLGGMGAAMIAGLAHTIATSVYTSV